MKWRNLCFLRFLLKCHKNGKIVNDKLGYRNGTHQFCEIYQECSPFQQDKHLFYQSAHYHIHELSGLLKS
jgi:hypothetical protein